jgi:hypothetical protein
MENPHPQPIYTSSLTSPFANSIWTADARLWFNAGVLDLRLMPVHNLSAPEEPARECKGCPGTFCKACHETGHVFCERIGTTDTKIRKDGPPAIEAKLIARSTDASAKVCPKPLQKVMNV